MRGGRKHILTCIVLLAAAAVCAQPRLRQAEIYAGVHGGVLMSTVIFQPSMSNTAFHFSGNGGAVFRYNNLKYCGIQAELNYMQRGWHEKITSANSVTGRSGIYFRRMDYIELPVLMHLYVGNEHWRGFLNAGPQIGFCIHEMSQGAQSKTVTAQYGRVYYPFDWGIAAGLGFCYRSGKAGVFQLEGRFNYSFGDVFDHSKQAYFDQSHAMNISANIGWLWEFKKTKKSTLP